MLIKYTRIADPTPTQKSVRTADCMPCSSSHPYYSEKCPPPLTLQIFVMRSFRMKTFCHA